MIAGVPLRGGAYQFVENAHEMALIAKAEVIRDLHEGEPVLPQ
jgi:hypothetical protein